MATALYFATLAAVSVLMHAILIALLVGALFMAVVLLAGNAYGFWRSS
jgi:hypothetical protein